MKTKSILCVLWLALGSIISICSLWTNRNVWGIIFAGDIPFSGFFPPSYDLFLVMLGPLYLFSAIAGVFLFRGARWASISIGVISLLTVIVCIRGLVVNGLVPTWDGLLGCLALITALISAAVLSFQSRYGFA
jgi:hypothetical protein